MIFAQGDAAEAVFYLEAGRVKLTVVSPHGKEAIVAMLEPDSFFGESCLAGEEFCLVTAVALAPCTLVRIDKHVMTRVLREEPTAAERFLRFLLARTMRVQEDLADQLLHSSEQRLARALFLLAHHGNASDAQSVIPKISQDTLADMVGTTRPRVSYFMKKFKQLGHITYIGNCKSEIQIHASLSEVLEHS